MTEVIFEVREDTADGGFTASALGLGIHTEADTTEALRANVREAVDCYFGEAADAPKIIRLHFVRDEKASDAWFAERAGFVFRGDNPIELLGLAAIHEDVN